MMVEIDPLISAKIYRGADRASVFYDITAHRQDGVA